MWKLIKQGNLIAENLENKEKQIIHIYVHDPAITCLCYVLDELFCAIFQFTNWTPAPSTV